MGTESMLQIAGRVGLPIVAVYVPLTFLFCFLSFPKKE